MTLEQTRAAPATIKDVAARAGVSWKTVTNVVHGRPGVRPTTRQRVLTAIEELDYRPVIAGRQLRQQRSQTIALVLPDLVNPYFAQLAEAITGSAGARGFAVFVEHGGSATEPERAAVMSAMRFAADGVILSPTFTTSQELAALARRRPIVLLGESVDDAALDLVAIDNRTAAHEVTAHLIERGRRRVASLGHRPGADLPPQPSRVRHEGFRNALRRAGLELRPELQIPARAWTHAGGYAGTSQLLASGTPFDALVCVNDLLAVGALRALREAGLGVPDDVAVTGWDDVPEAEYSAPPLTTVAAHVHTLAEQAVTVLLGRIEAATVRPAEHYTVPHTVVVRASSG